MRKISIVLIGLFASLNCFAQVFTNAQIEEILKENEALKAENEEYVTLLNDAISAKKETLMLKNILRRAGLSVDLKNASLRLLDEQKFMTKCNVVIFNQSEFDALNTEEVAGSSQENAPKGQEKPYLREEDAAMEKDFRKAAKGDFSDKSKEFWNSVIY